MRSILTAILLLTAGVSFTQTDTSAFYAGKNTITEVRGDIVHVYSYQTVSSNSFKRSEYVHSGTISLQEFRENLTRKHSKMKPVSAQNAKQLLIIDYVECREYELAHELNAAYPYAAAIPKVLIKKGYYTVDWDYDNSLVETQRQQIDADFAVKKDSLFAVHHDYTMRTDAFILNIANENLESTVQFLATVPSFEEQGWFYMEAILEAMAERNPALYFQLLESFTGNRTNYYFVLDHKHVRMLKKYDTDSPLRKELLKTRRAQAWKSAGVVSLTLAWNGALAAGIVYLVKRNKD